MADNTSTKVLTIDTGNAISNVKDFKAKIEELKGALLGLESGTEEYNAVAKELRNSQQKLTEVMDVAKGKAEGVEGSYDNLVAKMRDLKQEWRATADEAERASLGAQILDINNQLKDLDASTGNFQRNVGDYANAFEEAFKNVFQGIGQSNTALAESSKTIVKLIPLIKKATTTATVGLQGIQKAIIATGIGALVIAVGLLAANWDKVTEAVRESIPALKQAYNAEKDIEKVSESIKRIKEQSKEATDYEVRMMQARKASEREILDYKIKQQKVEIRRLETQTAIALKAWKELEAEREKSFLYKLSEKALGIYENHIDKAIQKAVEVYNLAKAAENEAKKDLDVYTTTAEYQDKEPNGTGGGSATKETADKDKNLIESIKKRLKAFEDATKSELELLEERYKKEKELFEKNGEDITQLTEEYEAERTRIIAEADLKRMESEEELNQFKADMAVKNAEKTIDNIEAVGKNKAVKLDLEFKLKGNGNDILENLKNEADRINGIFEIEKGVLQEKINTLQNLLNQLDPESEEYLSIKEELAQTTMELDNLVTQNYLGNKDLEDAKDKEVTAKRMKRLAIAQDGLQSLGSLISSIGDLMEEQINKEVENKEISEDAAKDRFKSVKAMQIAATVINTVAGAIGAFMQASSTYPPPYGQIIGGISAAAVAAAGAVQIAQIRRQQYGSDNSGSITTPDLQRASMPTQIQPVQNITGQDETTQLANAINSQPVIVKVTDIDDVNQIKDSTIAESTF